MRLTLPPRELSAALLRPQAPGVGSHLARRADVRLPARRTEVTPRLLPPCRSPGTPRGVPPWNGAAIPPGSAFLRSCAYKNRQWQPSLSCQVPTHPPQPVLPVSGHGPPSRQLPRPRSVSPVPPLRPPQRGVLDGRPGHALGAGRSKGGASGQRRLRLAAPPPSATTSQCTPAWAFGARAIADDR